MARRSKRSCAARSLSAAALLLACAGAAFAAAAAPDGCEFIRAALRALPASGGEVDVPAGLFECRAMVDIARDGVTLRGAGKGATTLRLADAAQAPLLVVGDPDSVVRDGRAQTAGRVRGVTVIGLTLDGNRWGQDVNKECGDHSCAGDITSIRNNALTVRGASAVLIEDVETKDAVSGGLVLEKQTDGVHVIGLSSHGNYFDGLAACQTSKSVLESLDLWGNRAAGLSLDCGFNDNRISNARLRDNGDVGLFLRDARGNLFEDVDVSGSASYGVYLGASAPPNGCPQDNELRGLTVSGSGRQAVDLDYPCPGNRITGASLLSGGGKGCVKLASGAALPMDSGVRCLP